MAGADDQISAEAFEACLRPREALRLVQGVYPDIGVASRAIHDRLLGGLVHAVAKSSSWEDDGTGPTGIVRIQPDHWSAVTNKTAEWWDTGQIRVFVKRRQGSVGVVGRFYGVRFDAADIQEIIGDAPARAPTSTPAAPGPERAAPHAGGRPPWPGWDALWVEVARQLYEGALIPTKQADIETAMLAIAEEAEDGPKIAVIRTRARRLWAAIKPDG